MSTFRLTTIEEFEAATQRLLETGAKVGADSWQARVKNQTPHCKFGEEGICCRICTMGPCRITKKAPRGICGCDAHGIAGRNFLRFTAGGAATHSDHGREICHTLHTVSPDGNYLMFTLSGYGNFSIWHPESDLYLLDLRNGEVRCLKEVNSKRVESFHNWSSSGKWFVFSSKRIDGLWAHPYIASFDPSTGVAGKPFPVPQEEPDFYLTFMQSFNLPEFLIRPVTENRESFEQIQNKCLSSSPNQL